tara:strand:- start:6184 stop:6321 length:138 start_codon:yes stop_codon:yes gene_type:complete
MRIAVHLTPEELSLDFIAANAALWHFVANLVAATSLYHIPFRGTF